MFNRTLYFLGSVFINIYAKLMLKVNVVCHEQMHSGAKIIVSNHPTTSDPFVLTTMTKGQASILIKDILFKIPLFGTYLRWAGHIPVTRDKGRDAFEAALKHLIKGKSIVVFIEGDITTSKNRPQKPKTGAVRLALSSGLPIIPIGIAVKKVNIKLLDSVIDGVKEEGVWYFKGPYEITVGRAFKVSGDTKDRNRVRLLSDLVLQKVTRLAYESAKRIPPTSA